MNDKINIQDIVDVLAEKNSMTKKDADIFVRSMFDLIEDSLEKDRYIKVKGLGTFKLIDVDERESINVNTGERFRIEGHSKIVFTPDSSLKDIINKPFSHFETVILNEGVDLKDVKEENTPVENTPIKEGDSNNQVIQEESEDPVSTKEPIKEEVVNNDTTEVSQEIKDKIGSEENEEQTENIERLKSASPQSPQNHIQEPNEAEQENVQQPDSLKEDKENTDESTIEKTPFIKDETTTSKKVVDSKPATSSLNEHTLKAMKEEEKSSHKAIFIIIGVTVVLVGLIVWFALDMQNKQNTISTKPIVEQKVNPQLNKAKSDTLNIAGKDSAAIQVNGQAVNLDDMNPKTQNLNFRKKYVTDGTMDEHVMEKGESLSDVSKKYYGTTLLVRYICEYNKDIIKNPDVISDGITLKIPRLKPAQ